MVLAVCSRSASGPSTADTPSTSAPPTPGTPAEVPARSTVPVLCFHQLRELRADDSAYAPHDDHAACGVHRPAAPDWLSGDQLSDLDRAEPSPPWPDWPSRLSTPVG
jgi:hypothetical protein